MKRKSGSRKLDVARYGYSATPEKRQTGLAYQQGAEEKRQTIDKLRFETLQRKWRQDRLEKGREGWNDLGNKNIPIHNHKKDVMRTVASNRVALLSGETGSGKSTQLAQYALEMGYDRVVYLQPRRVNADNIADRVDYELREQFADKGLDYADGLVGVSHSERSTMRPNSMVQVMTSAVFKKRATEMEEIWRDEKVLVVADEVHEGNIETEFAVAAAAEMMERRQGWNMVLMSATMDEKKIQDAYSSLNGTKIPTIEIKGRPHPIEYNERANKTSVDVYSDECFESGAKTIIFTDGVRSMNAIKKELESRYTTDEIEVLKLSSKTDNATRLEIFTGESEEGVRRVIVSTSAGQSGITIPGLGRVITDGWTKSPELDSENASGLPRRLCSRAELTQQMGRGGRDIAGAKFYLAKAHPYKKRAGAPIDRFTSFKSRKREDHIPPDIYHTSISTNVLAAAAMDKDFYALNEYLMNKVTYATIDEAYTILWMLGAVDDSHRVTDIGHTMDRLPLRPELARAVTESLNYDEMTQLQVGAIAAGIEAGGQGSYSDREVANQRLASETTDDFIAELDLFCATRRHFGEIDSIDSEFAKDGLDAINSRRAFKQFRKICEHLGIDEETQLTLTNHLTQKNRHQLHEILLTGMPHLLYGEAGRSQRRGRRTQNPDGSKQPQKVDVRYRNILGPPKGEEYALDRKIGRGSVLAATHLAKGTMVAGYPRWFIDDEDTTHNIIQQGFPTTPAVVKRVLGRQAMNMKDHIQIDPDGRLSRIRTGYLGSMAVSSTKKNVAASDAGAIDKMVTQALNTPPGSAQRELRQLKNYLEDLTERVPARHRSSYFKHKHTTINESELRSILQKAAEGSRSMGELDARIRKQNVSIRDYISEYMEHEILQTYPRVMTIGDVEYDVEYEGEEAQPIIVLRPSEAIHISPTTRGVYLQNGVEVLFRYRGGSDQLFVAGEVAGK